MSKQIGEECTCGKIKCRCGWYCKGYMNVISKGETVSRFYCKRCDIVTKHLDNCPMSSSGKGQKLSESRAGIRQGGEAYKDTNPRNSDSASPQTEEFVKKNIYETLESMGWDFEQYPKTLRKDINSIIECSIQKTLEAVEERLNHRIEFLEKKISESKVPLDYYQERLDELKQFQKYNIQKLKEMKEE